MKHPRTVLCMTAVAISLLSPAVYAKVIPATIFDSNMVLQREKPVPVWGKADPGEAVEVKFAGQTLKTKADANGKWEVTLAPMKANAKGQTMTLKGKNTVTLKNILVGDIWLCAGQSNMEMSFAWKVINGDEHIKEAKKYPLIRRIKVMRTASDIPAENIQVQTRWSVCSPATVKAYTAAGYYFARRIHIETGVPIGILDDNWSGSPIQPFIVPTAYKDIPALKQEWQNVKPFIPGTPEYKKQIQGLIKRANTWVAKAEAALKKGEPAPAAPGLRPYPPAGYRYNIMMAPIVRFPIKGAIWYQGCSNAGNGMKYYHYMHALVKGWRAVWKDDFPFFFVQLAAYTKATNDPKGGNGYALIREAQRKAMDIPKSGMACTIDIGMQNDIHPKNKYDVGERLALWALRDVYGKKDIVVSGPLFKSMEIKDGKAVLTFDYAKGLMTAKKTGLEKPVKINAKPAHFAIAGADKVWYWADAKIDGEKVILSSDKVKTPVAVRYAYRAYPDGVNMYNAAGLPMVPFRTDNW